MGSRLGAVHAGRRALELDDDTYRDILFRVAQKRSSKDCTDGELGLVLDEFRRLGWGKMPRRTGKRTHRSGPQILKIKALWSSLFHLGEVRDRSDKALAKFVERTTGKAALQWCTASDLASVTEALRDWCGRAGFVVPDQAMEKEATAIRDGLMLASIPGAAAKAELIEVLWEKLIASRAFKDGSLPLYKWLDEQVGRPIAAPIHLPSEWFDPLIERLGEWLRKIKS